MIVAEAAGGVSLFHTAYDIATALSLPAQLQNGRLHMDEILRMCEEWGDDFDEKDKAVLAEMYKKLVKHDKMVEANNRFPKYLKIPAIIQAQKFSASALQLKHQTRSLSKEVREKKTILHIPEPPPEHDEELGGSAGASASENVRNDVLSCSISCYEDLVEEIEMNVLS